MPAASCTLAPPRHSKGPPKRLFRMFCAATLQTLKSSHPTGRTASAFTGRVTGLSVYVGPDYVRPTFDTTGAGRVKTSDAHRVGKPPNPLLSCAGSSNGRAAALSAQHAQARQRHVRRPNRLGARTHGQKRRDLRRRCRNVERLPCGGRATHRLQTRPRAHGQRPPSFLGSTRTGSNTAARHPCNWPANPKAVSAPRRGRADREFGQRLASAIAQSGKTTAEVNRALGLSSGVSGRKSSRRVGTFRPTAWRSPPSCLASMPIGSTVTQATPPQCSCQSRKPTGQRTPRRTTHRQQASSTHPCT